MRAHGSDGGSVLGGAHPLLDQDRSGTSLLHLDLEVLEVLHERSSGTSDGNNSGLDLNGASGIDGDFLGVVEVLHV